ncbi:hypothetical protein FH621_07695 [Latilactobacillus curvatus]|uniref:hypothetical protein n=1 Tax=Latilactobacillus curvatus TaxID=28038 RepID=UPI00217E8700|nr:hypothetical protein [Latilactobacillus curvatus]MCS6143409.1 hypothetical protein [Latilactobacillus curvatus]
MWNPFKRKLKVVYIDTVLDLLSTKDLSSENTLFRNLTLDEKDLITHENLDLDKQKEKYKMKFSDEEIRNITNNLSSLTNSEKIFFKYTLNLYFNYDTVSTYITNILNTYLAVSLVVIPIAFSKGDVLNLLLSFCIPLIIYVVYYGFSVRTKYFCKAKYDLINDILTDHDTNNSLLKLRKSRRSRYHY